MAGSSFFAGVSGLKNHQTRMDVIGNNIANVNTHGFKVGRLTFSDLISQTYRGPSQPAVNRGGTNGIQVGLGAQVASIDNLMTAGVMETTGRQTDLAVQGNGFFVVQSGTNKFYTRNGNFGFDRDGTLVNPSGFRVQGWSTKIVGEDNTVSIDTTGPVGDLHLLVGEKIEAKQTEQVLYRSNLDASSRDMGAALSSDRLVDLYNGNDLTPNHLGIKPGDVLQIAVEIDQNNPPNTANDPGGGFDVRYFQVSNNTTLKDLEGFIQETVDAADRAGVANVTASFANGVFSLQNETLGTNTHTAYLSVRAASGTEIRNFGRLQSPPEPYENLTDHLQMVKEFFEANDAAGGLGRDAFNLAFNNGMGTAGNNIVLNYENIILNNSEVVEVGGSIFADFSGVTTAADGGGAVPLNSQNSGLVQGSDTRKTSIDVFDSLGNKHTLQVTFQHIGTTQNGGVQRKNFWEWRPLFEFADEFAFDSLQTTSPNYFTFKDDGLLDPLNSLTGSIKFDASPLIDDGTGQLISSKAIKVTDSILRWGEADDLIHGITQFASEFTTAAIGQDGYPLGVLDSFFVDQLGTINGIYSNDQRRPVGQVALAVFDNAEGLVKTGGTLFQESNNSGIARVMTATTGGAGEVIAATLEQSNVDLSQEFTNMIITQRGFQANARTITTSDEMLQELIALKR